VRSEGIFEERLRSILVIGHHNLRLTLGVGYMLLDQLQELLVLRD
jgi:hypothetical protein